MASRRSWLIDMMVAGDRTVCWDWPGYTIKGYGRIWHKGRHVSVSHLVLEMDGRPRPNPSAQALHSCDRSICVNPRHLRWGTALENVQDAITRDRRAIGIRHPRARFTNDQVRLIRERAESGEGFRLIARSLGTTHRIIALIVYGKSYRDAPGPTRRPLDVS